MKTPRTDLIVTGNSDPTVDEYEDLATFTRQLERELSELATENHRLRIALHEAINRPKGVVPNEAEGSRGVLRARLLLHHNSPVGRTHYVG
jgi:hypothetical protein